MNPFNHLVNSVYPVYPVRIYEDFSSLEKEMPQSAEKLPESVEKLIEAFLSISGTRCELFAEAENQGQFIDLKLHTLLSKCKILIEKINSNKELDKYYENQLVEWKNKIEDILEIRRNQRFQSIPSPKTNSEQNEIECRTWSTKTSEAMKARSLLQECKSNRSIDTFCFYYDIIIADQNCSVLDFLPTVECMVEAYESLGVHALNYIEKYTEIQEFIIKHFKAHIEKEFQKQMKSYEFDCLYRNNYQKELFEGAHNISLLFFVATELKLKHINGIEIGSIQDRVREIENIENLEPFKSDLLAKFLNPNNENQATTTTTTTTTSFPPDLDIF